MAKDFADINRLEHEAGIQAPEASSKDELVNKFVKAWENQTARRVAKGGTGLTMALTLAACGSDSGGATITALREELGITEEDLGTAEAALTTLQESATATEEELEAAEENIATLTEQRDAAEAALTTLQESATATEEELEAAEENIATLTEQRDAALAEIADAAETTALTNLLTLSDAVNTVDVTGLGDDVALTVSGLTPGADEQTATITSDGNGTLTFNFVDGDDTLTLAANSDISGFTSIEIVGGTVDLTSVDLGDVTSITVSSGVVMSFAQFAGLEDGVIGGSDDSTVEIIVNTAQEALLVAATIEKLGGTLRGDKVTLSAAADSEITEAELAEQQAALNAAFVEGGIDEALPTALEALSAANAAVTAQEEAIADFLEAAFENELVAALADDDEDGELNGNEVVEVADIAAANVAAADVFAKDDEGEPVGADFVALTDAQQEAEIGLARVDLLVAINDAETDLETAADALEDGVAALVAVADAKAEDLTEALDAKDDADEATANAEAIAGLNVSSTDGESTPVSLDSSSFSFEDSSDGGDYNEFVVAFTGGKSDTSETVDLAEVVEGVVTVDDTAVTADDTAGTYSFVVTVDTVSYTVTIDQTYLDSLVSAAQAEYDAAQAQTAAEEALAEAVVDVLEAEDGSVDLTSNGSDVEDYAGQVHASVVDVTDNSVTLDYSGANSQNGTEYGAVEIYRTELVDLAEAEEALSDFNDAVTAFEATEVLVDELEALNETLDTREAAVTSAEEAITNATDADEDAGLGLNLAEFADGDATADSDVYVFEGDAGETVTIVAFGAEGTDRLFFGETYTFVEMDADAEIGDALGDVATLEIFAEETDDGVTLYVEDIASAGAGSGTADMTTVELADVTLADLSFDASGILSAEAAIV